MQYLKISICFAEVVRQRLHEIQISFPPAGTALGTWVLIFLSMLGQNCQIRAMGSIHLVAISRQAFLGDHRERWLLCPERFMLLDLGMWWHKQGYGRAVVTLQRSCAQSSGDFSSVSSVIGWLMQLEERYISFCSSCRGLISCFLLRLYCAHMLL